MPIIRIIQQFVLTITVTFSIIACQSQERIEWKQASEWKLYKLTDVNSFAISETDLKKKENLSIDSLQYFIANAQPLKSNCAPVWKDFFITSCQVNGKFRKVIFSSYGGFFYDGKNYYAVKEENRKPLVEYLENKAFD